MQISIIGSGYVGLTTGALFGCAGHKVYCIDIDQRKIDIINKGKSHFFEPGLDHFVSQAVSSGNMLATTEYKEAISNSDVVFICVGTPSKQDGSVDLSYVFSAVKEIIKYMPKGLIIVQKSTVPVNTCREIEKRLLAENKKGSVLSCPEFLSESTAVLDTLIMDRFVIGGDSEKAKTKVISLFSSLNDYAKSLDFSVFTHFSKLYHDRYEETTAVPFKDRVLSISLESAELIKVTANAYLATKISFANSIARIAKECGADINEVMEGIGRDKRIGRSFLYAGLGWGGGCFPKDTSGLVHFSNKVGFEFDMLKAAININNDQANYILTKIKEEMGSSFKKKKVGVLGLAFKPGTSDVRDSPALKLISELLKLKADIVVYDPIAMDDAKKVIKNHLKYVESVYEVFASADAVILATEWPEFINIDFMEALSMMNGKILFDARNKWSKAKIEKAGGVYLSI